MEKINLTLPEFVFLDGSSHSQNELLERTVIQHIRSYTILVVFFQEEFEILHLDCNTFTFQFQNHYGITENHIFALHLTLADENELPEIFEKCKIWYCDYLKWEDDNIIEDGICNEMSKHN